MSKFSLLAWMEKGKHTLVQASRSERDQKPEWDLCLFGGLFEVAEDGTLQLTEEGRGELKDIRSGGG